MRKLLTTIAVLTAASTALATTAAAGPLAAKQRVQLQVRGLFQPGLAGSFVLAPMTSGAVKRDTGGVSYCCPTRLFVTHDGLTNEIDTPQVTLTGRRGTLVLRYRMENFDILDAWSVFTSSWKVIRGTGDYSGLSGGGTGAGVVLADGHENALFEGFLSPK